MSDTTPRFDVIVLGAGPAGSAAANVLGQRGKRVLLVDKSHFPREKTCGDGLTYKCAAPMQRLGIFERFRARARTRTVGYSLCFSDATEVALRRPAMAAAPFVYVMPRYELDEIVLDGALAHPTVEFRPGVGARELVFDEARRIVGIRLESNGVVEELRAPVVIDATGANSQLAVQVGAGNQDPRRSAIAVRGYYEDVDGLDDTVGFYFDKRVLPGYFWIFPTGERTCNAGVGTFQHVVDDAKLDLRRMMHEFVTGHPVASRKLGKAKLVGTLKGGKIPFGADVERSRVRDGFVMVGDAGSFSDPVTAEGISYALASGILAADAVADALDEGDVSAAALAPYDDGWRAAFGSQFARAPVLTTGLPRAAFTHSVASIFDGGPGADALDDRTAQYELLFKLKTLVKSL